MLRYLFIASTATLFAGCASVKQSWESAPVEVKTESGTVECQLYTPNAVLWDRAVRRPSSMSDEAANRICRAEGEMRRGKPAADSASTEAGL